MLVSAEKYMMEKRIEELETADRYKSARFTFTQIEHSGFRCTCSVLHKFAICISIQNTCDLC